MTRQSAPPASLPEDEEMDPVGEPYPDQEPLLPGNDNEPPDLPRVSRKNPDIPQDPESERVIQPEPAASEPP